MADSLENAKSGIRKILPPPARSPNVVVCEVRQVPPQHFTDLPPALYPSIRRGKVAVRRRPRPYWQERGWRRKGDVYQGCYQVNGESYKGRVVKTETSFNFYIIDPPYQVGRNPCFRHRGDGRYWVHWHGSPPRTVSSGIISVELAIRDALM